MKEKKKYTHQDIDVYKDLPLQWFFPNAYRDRSSRIKTRIILTICYLVVVIGAIILHSILNSVWYRDNILKPLDVEFHGKVIKKHEHFHGHWHFYVSNERVDNFRVKIDGFRESVFDFIEIGDSVVCNKHEDTIYVYRHNNLTLLAKINSD